MCTRGGVGSSGVCDGVKRCVQVWVQVGTEDGLPAGAPKDCVNDVKLSVA